jgi:hypothetical protein
LVARVEDFFGMAPRTAAPPAEFPGWKNISNPMSLCRCGVTEMRESLRALTGATPVMPNLYATSRLGGQSLES